jgi:hypothetical protein
VAWPDEAMMENVENEWLARVTAWEIRNPNILKKISGKQKNSQGNAEAAEGEIWVWAGMDDADDADEKKFGDPMHVLVGRVIRPGASAHRTTIKNEPA